MEECEHGSPYGACVLRTCPHSLAFHEEREQSLETDFILLEAKYPGYCNCGCGERFDEGDSIMWGPDQGIPVLEEHFKEYARG